MPTTVKLSDDESKLLHEVRDRIVRDGTAPFVKMAPVCPKCREKLSGISVTAEHWECPKCGYSQNGINLGAGGLVALGAVVGVGLTALLWWLSSNSD